MFDIGWPELALVVVVALLFFGPKRIPEAAKALGQSIKAFKDGLKEASEGAQTAKTEVKKLPEETKT